MSEPTEKIVVIKEKDDKKDDNDDYKAKYEEEKAKKEDLKAKLELIAEKESEKLREQYAEEFPEQSKEIEDMEIDKLVPYVEGLRASKGSESENLNPATPYGGGASGNATLASQQKGYGKTGYNQAFNNFAEMMRFLRKEEREGSEKAKEIIDDLFRKSLKTTPKGVNILPSKEEQEKEYKITPKKGFYKIKRK